MKRLVVRFPLALLVLCLGLAGASLSLADGTNDPQIAAIQARRDDAIARVKEIINQPVTQLPRTSDMTDVGEYPYWFHDGATRPDFNNVDIRTTQEFHYDDHQYAASALNPGVVFIGHELEFNQYYRDIGYCEHQLAVLQLPALIAANQESAAAAVAASGPETPLDEARQLAATHKPVVAGIGVGLVAGLWYLRRRRQAAN